MLEQIINNIKNDMIIETAEVNDTLKNMKSQKDIFILIIGGSGSGKNYFYEKNLKNIPLVDNDAITKKLSGGDFEKARKLVSKATSIANKMLTDAFNEKKSVCQVSTGTNEKAVFNKFKKAKDAGMKTGLILIDADINDAQKRNVNRASGGKQGLVPDWKVEKTNIAAKKTYKNIKNNNVVDFAFIAKN